MPRCPPTPPIGGSHSKAGWRVAAAVLKRRPRLAAQRLGACVWCALAVPLIVVVAPLALAPYTCTRSCAAGYCSGVS
eukprot:2233063-Prymnesium_polylepis.2